MSHSEIELVQQAAAGNEDALGELLLSFGPRVAKSLSINPRWQAVVDVDDVMQVTYVEAFLRIKTLQAENPSAFRTWLQRIAENNLRDAIKHEGRDKRPHNRLTPIDQTNTAFLDMIAAPGTTPSSSVGRRELQGMVQDVMRKLPGDYERVLRMYELEGRSARQIAAEMGRSIGAVKMLIARAKDRLTELLGGGTKFFGDSA